MTTMNVSLSTEFADFVETPKLPRAPMRAPAKWCATIAAGSAGAGGAWRDMDLALACNAPRSCGSSAGMGGVAAD